MICKKCGHELEGNNKFCVFCGEPIVKEVETLTSVKKDIHVCENCGAELKSDNLFCGMCGHKSNVENESFNVVDNTQRPRDEVDDVVDYIKKEMAEENNESQRIVVEQPKEVPVNDIDFDDDDDDVIEEIEEVKNKESKPVVKRWWFWLIIGIVILIGAGVMLFFNFQYNNAKSEAITAVEQYNVAAQEYNDKVANFNDAIIPAYQEVSKLDSEIAAAQKALDNKDEALDETLRTDLQAYVDSCNKNKMQVPEPLDYVQELPKPGDNLSKEDYEKAKADADEAMSKIGVVEDVSKMEKPNYEIAINSLRQMTAALTKSIEANKIIGNPDSEVITEKIKTLPSVVSVDKLASDNDRFKKAGVKEILAINLDGEDSPCAYVEIYDTKENATKNFSDIDDSGELSKQLGSIVISIADDRSADNQEFLLGVFEECILG